MAFRYLKGTFPWGRPLDEYVSMFNLTPTELDQKILDCSAGPSSICG